MLDITCGTFTIPETIAVIVSMLIKAFYIGVPILLIVWGMLDLGKAVIQQKEDEIKKGWKTFLSRLFAALIVFFVVVIVKFVVGLVVEGGTSSNIVECIDKILKA